MRTRIRNAVLTLRLKRKMRSRTEPVKRGVHVTGGMPYLGGKGRVEFGEGFHCRSTGTPASFHAEAGAIIRIGDHGFVNTGVSLYAQDEIQIGKHCKIGDGCTLSDFGFHAVHQGQTVKPRPIRLGDNVWLGRGVIILPGVTIGDHSVIAAGSVVFEDVPTKQVWRGNPAAYHKDVRCDDGFVRD